MATSFTEFIRATPSHLPSPLSVLICVKRSINRATEGRNTNSATVAGPDGNIYTYPYTGARFTAPCSQWNCNHEPESRRTCAQHAPQSAKRENQKRRASKREREERRGRRRGISIRRSSTSMEAAELVEEAAPYRRDGGSLSILPRDKERRSRSSPSI